MSKLLVEQVDDCLSRGRDILGKLVGTDGSRGVLNSRLAADEPLDKLLASILQMIEGQDEAIRLIAAAAQSS